MTDWAKIRAKAATEDTVENHLVKEVKKRKGTTIKVRFMRGWPDRIVLLPYGKVLFVELKRPHGGKFEPLQERIHMRLRNLGFRVAVCWSKEDVDVLLEECV